MSYEEKLEILRNKLKTIDGTTDFGVSEDWMTRMNKEAVTIKDRVKMLQFYFKLIRFDDK